jgi:hypothetical protein
MEPLSFTILNPCCSSNLTSSLNFTYSLDSIKDNQTSLCKTIPV